MASIGSGYSGSPESKSTLDTPENGPYDNFFSLTTPSDLRLSLSDDSYAEWKALPSRLLESPPPQLSTIQFRKNPGGLAGGSNDLDGHDLFDVDEPLRNQHSSPVNATEVNLVQRTETSSPHAAVGRHKPECSNTDRKSHHLPHGLKDQSSISNHILQDWNPETTESSTTPTRHLKICNIAPTTSLVILYELLQEFGDIQEFYTQKLFSDGFCVVSYFDIRDAITTYLKLQAEKALAVQFCSGGYVTMLVMGNNLSGGGVDNRLEVMGIIFSGGCSSNVRRMYYVLSDFGAISKFTVLENTCPPTFFATFFDAQDASDIIDTVDGQYVEGFRLKLSLYDSDIPTWNRVFSALRTQRDENDFVPSQAHDMGMSCPQPVHPDVELSCRRDSRSSDDSGFSVDRESDSYTENMYSGGYVTQKRSGLAPVSLKHNLETFRRTPSRCQPDLRQLQEVFSYLPSGNPHRTDIKTQDILTSVSPSFQFQLFGSEISKLNSERLHSQMQVPGKNVIDLDRIARGLDTRTTVMLRNIPNKVDQHTLKEYVDTTSRGLYNFLYLRIDFRNICNVGYAFINFIDPLDIIDFVKAKSGTRWNKFNSEKVLDVTYANIQGIDQLVEKFRNSSVMDQDPSYRPKLFHSSGPFAGTEMEFPPANNILKKCRSISAAQQIGLFAPKMSATGKGVWRKRE